jgi:hypothetical protein
MFNIFEDLGGVGVLFQCLFYRRLNPWENRASGKHSFMEITMFCTVDKL